MERVGKLRAFAKNHWNSRAHDDDDLMEPELSEEMLVPSPNGIVCQRGGTHNLEDEEESARRRMKWVAQISEFWSLERLASLTEMEMEQLLNVALMSPERATDGVQLTSQHDLTLQRTNSPLPDLGHIYLVGSGPGHPSFLTIAAHSLLTSNTTHLILTDKLVPAGVLDLIPKHIEVRVARKFPGNADGAQTELMEMAGCRSTPRQECRASEARRPDGIWSSG